MPDNMRDRLRATRDHDSPTARKPGEAMPGAAGQLAKERTVRITLDLPASMHRQLRVRVAQDGTDAQKFLRRLLEQELRNHGTTDLRTAVDTDIRSPVGE